MENQGHQMVTGTFEIQTHRLKTIRRDIHQPVSQKYSSAACLNMSQQIVGKERANQGHFRTYVSPSYPNVEYP